MNLESNTLIKEEMERYVNEITVSDDDGRDEIDKYLDPKTNQIIFEEENESPSP